MEHLPRPRRARKPQATATHGTGRLSDAKNADEQQKGRARERRTNARLLAGAELGGPAHAAGAVLSKRKLVKALA
jgi:hypothetical protein